MLFWDHNTNNLRDWSQNMIFWTLGSLPEPHFLRWDQSHTLIGTPYFNLKLKISLYFLFFLEPFPYWLLNEIFPGLSIFRPDKSNLLTRDFVQLKSTIWRKRSYCSRMVGEKWWLWIERNWCWHKVCTIPLLLSLLAHNF